MDKSHDKLIDTIRKLLALAGSSNESEAALALERAQALLLKHNLATTHGLTLDAIRNRVKGTPIEMDGGILTEPGSYSRMIGQGVGLLCGCQYFYTPQKIKGYTYDENGFIGQPHSIKVARLMYEYLLRTVGRIVDTAVSSGSAPVIRRSFREGCAYRLHQRMAARANATLAFNTGLVPGHQLPMVISERDAIAEQIKEFVKQRASSFAVVSARAAPHDHAAFYAGADAGERISIDPQVGGGGTKALT